VTAGVRSVDHGYDALLKRVFGFGHPTVVMGILEADGAKAKKPWPEEAEVEPGLTVIDVANWMEFGTDDDPPRSFIRKWFDEASPKMREDFVKLMQSVVRGTRTKEQILELLGQRAVGEIQARISAGIDPPNTLATRKRKGSSKPLIASGQLRSSITYAVREK
jgi:hypothetical protein